MNYQFITFKSQSGSLRRMIVVDGQPYYQSTGQNSKRTQEWLPFLMAVDKQSNIKEHGNVYDFSEVNRAINLAKTGSEGYVYILKMQRDYFKDKSDFIFGGYTPTEKTKETSKAIEKIENTLEDTYLTYSTAADINGWLAQQRALFVTDHVEGAALTITNSTKQSSPSLDQVITSQDHLEGANIPQPLEEDVAKDPNYVSQSQEPSLLKPQISIINPSSFFSKSGSKLLVNGCVTALLGLTVAAVINGLLLSGVLTMGISATIYLALALTIFLIGVVVEVKGGYDMVNDTGTSLGT